MNVIKPCPFCGCEYSKDDDDFLYSGEHEIGASSLMFPGYDIENWNKRSTNSVESISSMTRSARAYIWWRYSE